VAAEGERNRWVEGESEGREEGRRGKEKIIEWGERKESRRRKGVMR